VFFGGDAAFGPKNIIWAVAHGHEAAVSIDKLCQGEDVSKRPPPMVHLMSQKMGIHEWSYDNEIALDRRYKVPWRDASQTLKNIKIEVEMGFDVATAWKEAERCLNCDVQTVFSNTKCIECDACVDICPMDCITFTVNGEEPNLRALERAGDEPDAGPVRLGHAQDRPHHGQGRGRVPAAAVRRALPHRGLGYAEIPARDDSRRPRPAAGAEGGAGAGMSIKRIEAVNDFVIKFANVNGSGSAANELFARAISGWGCRWFRATFSLQHPGPAHLVRSAGDGEGWLGRRGGGPDGGDEPADLESGRE
jgi:ferredoxin